MTGTECIREFMKENPRSSTQSKRPGIMFFLFPLNALFRWSYLYQYAIRSDLSCMTWQSLEGGLQDCIWRIAWRLRDTEPWYSTAGLRSAFIGYARASSVPRLLGIWNCRADRFCATSKPSALFHHPVQLSNTGIPE